MVLDAMMSCRVAVGPTVLLLSAWHAVDLAVRCVCCGHGMRAFPCCNHMMHDAHTSLLALLFHTEHMLLLLNSGAGRTLLHVQAALLLLLQSIAECMCYIA